MASFEGKLKDIQFDIAKDYTKLDVTDEDFNFFDLVQGYCSHLAAVGDGQKRVHAVSDAKCSFCGSDHLVEDCPTLKKESKIEAAKVRHQNAINGEPNKRIIVCHDCQGVGHIRTDCPYRDKGGKGGKGGKGRPTKTEKKQAKAFLAWQESEKGATPEAEQTDTKPSAGGQAARTALSPEQPLLGGSSNCKAARYSYTWPCA